MCVNRSASVDNSCSHTSVSSLNGPKNAESFSDDTRFWLSATSVNRSFHSLISDTVPPRRPDTACVTSAKRRSRPQTFSWCKASRSVTSPCACACSVLSSSILSMSRSALSRKCCNVRFSRDTASGPFVGNCSNENSCAQCVLSQPSPRQNFNAGIAFLYSSIVSRSSTATPSFSSSERARSLHLARKSSSSYNFPRMEIQSRVERFFCSTRKSPSRLHASRVCSISAATSSSTGNSGRSMEKCSQSCRILLPSSLISSNARKSSSSLPMISVGSPCGILLGLNSSHRSRNASALEWNSAILFTIWTFRFSFCASRCVSSWPSFVLRFSHSESREEKSMDKAACALEPPACRNSLARSPTPRRISVIGPRNSSESFFAATRMFPISSMVCALASRSSFPETTNASISSFWRVTFRARLPESALCSARMCFSTADFSGWHDTV